MKIFLKKNNIFLKNKLIKKIDNFLRYVVWGFPRIGSWGFPRIGNHIRVVFRVVASILFNCSFSILFNCSFVLVGYCCLWNFVLYVFCLLLLLFFVFCRWWCCKLSGPLWMIGVSCSLLMLEMAHAVDVRCCSSYAVVLYMTVVSQCLHF